MADDIVVAFTLPTCGRFDYARQAAESFLNCTPGDRHVVFLIDDGSQEFKSFNWDAWSEGLSDPSRIIRKGFDARKGLTRSWNLGLQLAKEVGADYAISGNDDIIFTPNWHISLISALNSGFSLVGPVTNAPGKTNKGRQSVRHFFPNYKLTDDWDYLIRVSDNLLKMYGDSVVESKVNGFFTMAKVSTWWEGRFDANNVFDPRKQLAGNEDELQKRWHKLGWRTGFCPGSFIFHYRSVTRGKKYWSPGWYRPK